MLNKYIDALISIAITFCNLAAFYLSRAKDSFVPQQIRVYAVLSMAYLVLWGMYNLGSELFIFGTWARGFFQDYRHLSFILLAFAFVGLGERYFLKLLRYLIVLGYISVFGSLLAADISKDAILERSNTWTTSYYFWWILNAFAPFMGILYFSGLKQYRSKHLITLFLANVLIGLIFLKRAVVVNFVLVIVLSNLIANFKIRNLLYYTIGLFSMFYINSVLFQGLIDRFQTTSNEIESWDRLNEVNAVWDATQIYDWVVGFGANNYIRINHLGGDFEVNAIHIGILDIFYKGGVVYFGFIFFVVVSIWRSRRTSLFGRIGLVSSLLFALRLAYENSSSYTANIFFGMLFLIVIWMRSYDYSYR